MPIKSHFIQKALLKTIFNKKEIYIHTFPEGKLELMGLKGVGSSEDLFSGSQEYINELENRMNQSVENEIFNKVINTDKNSCITLTYEESILLRKYLLITYLRANLNNRSEEFKKIFTKLIDQNTNTNYKSRFTQDSNEAVNFFMHGSYMKFISHTDTGFAWPENYFLTMPFDTQNSDFPGIFNLVGRYSGYMFKIDPNHSIIISNIKLFESIMQIPNSETNKVEKVKFQLNSIDSGIWFSNSNKVIDPKGNKSNAFTLGKGITKEDIDVFRNEVSKRDKKLFKYEYPIEQMSNEDYELLLLDNLNKFSPIMKNRGIDILTYISDTKETLKLFEKWLDIEEYISANNPEDSIFWSRDINRKYQHKVWEAITDVPSHYLNNVILIIKQKKTK